MLDIFSKVAENQPASEAPPHYFIEVGSYKYPIGHELKGVLELLGQHNHIHWHNGGKWSMIDLLMGCIKYTGECAITLSSYAFSEKPARLVCDLRQQGVITNLRCLIDSRVDTRSASALTLLQNSCDVCTLTDTHAKVTLLHHAGGFLTITGSANYTTNKRLEAGIITSDSAAYHFHLNWLEYAMGSKKT